MLIVLLIFASVFLFEGDIPAAEVDAKYSNAESQFLVMENGARVCITAIKGKRMVCRSYSSTARAHMGALG